jgi:hypothetical protein
MRDADLAAGFLLLDPQPALAHIAKAQGTNVLSALGGHHGKFHAAANTRREFFCLLVDRQKVVQGEPGARDLDARGAGHRHRIGLDPSGGDRFAKHVEQERAQRLRHTLLAGAIPFEDEISDVTGADAGNDQLAEFVLDGLQSLAEGIARLRSKIPVRQNFAIAFDPVGDRALAFATDAVD